MLLRRITEHVKAQNWFAVGLDFLIVVVGVFIGIQVANWNDARASERDYHNAMNRLVEEGADTLQFTEQTRETINVMMSDVQLAIDVLRTCKVADNAETIVNQGLNTIRSARSAGAGVIAIDQLVEDARLLERQSDEERTILRQYHTDLHTLNATAEFVQQTVSVGSDTHPLTGFTELIDPKDTFNGVDVRRAQVDVPIEVACKDKSFLKLFYQWERGHVYHLSLIETMENTVRENMAALGLGDELEALMETR